MLYEKCLHCEKLGKGCNGPNFVDLSANEVLEWCKKRKAILKINNETISELSGVPKGTINRLFGGEKYDFYYETMRPVIKVLVGGKWQAPHCPKENKAPEQSSETVELLKGQIKWHKKIIAVLFFMLALSLTIIIVALIVDALNKNIGFIWR